MTATSRGGAITAGQARQLALLQTRAGVPYSGWGMSRREAAKAIRELIQAPPSTAKGGPRKEPARNGGGQRGPTAKQRRALRALGHDPAGLTRSQATAVIRGLRDAEATP